jgi:hypothetical protein
MIGEYIPIEPHSVNCYSLIILTDGFRTVCTFLTHGSGDPLKCLGIEPKTLHFIPVGARHFSPCLR